ncbi:MAG: VOC family protein [Planctomycetota bacterium]|nr:VOC family protein [Planctomycetota bacterium]
MATDSKHPPSADGHFVWHDLKSSDPDASKAFYAALFGWDIQDVPMGGAGMYRMITAAGEGQGGIEALEDEEAGSHWLAYVAVPDVDAAAKAASSAGGSVVMPPSDIPNVGRFAVVRDPSGATIAPFRSAQGDMPAPTTPPKDGQFCWHELLSRDAKACGPFYTRLVPWEQHSMTMPGPDGADSTYHLFRRPAESADRAGMMPMPSEAEGPSQWLPYVAVPDVDATCTQASALGATICRPPDDIPAIGRFAVLSDPQGASFAVFKGAQ